MDATNSESAKLLCADCCKWDRKLLYMVPNWASCMQLTPEAIVVTLLLGNCALPSYAWLLFPSA